VDSRASCSHTHTFRSTSAILAYNHRTSGRRLVVRIRASCIWRSLDSIPNRNRYVVNTVSGVGGR
jgi:hypothetical protein